MSGICAEFWTWKVTQELIEKKNKYFGDALLIRREFYWKNFSNLIKYTKKTWTVNRWIKIIFLPSSPSSFRALSTEGVGEDEF